MAKHTRHAVRAGVFMVISLALILTVIIVIVGSGELFAPQQEVHVAFSLRDDIGGLRPGDDVRLGGFKIGSIKWIHPGTDRASGKTGNLIAFTVPSRHSLHKDAHVVIQTTLTGASSLNVDELGTGDLWTPDDPPIIGHAGSFAALQNKLAEMGPKIDRILDGAADAMPKVNADLTKFGQTADAFTDTGHKASALVGDVHQRVPSIMDQYHDLVAHVVRMVDVVHDFIGPSTGDFHGTLADVHNITSGIKGNLPDILSSTKTILRRVDTSVGKADDALTDVRATVANTKDISATVRSVITDNKSKLDSMVSGLKTTSDNLKNASAEIRRSPWRLLYKPGPDEVANLNIYDSARQFADGANAMSDAAEALRDSLKDPNADPRDIKKLVEKLDDSFNHFQEVEKKLWAEVKP